PLVGGEGRDGVGQSCAFDDERREGRGEHERILLSGTAEGNTVSYAGMIRPVIDRVYVGLRRAAGSGARALYERWGLRPGMESDYYFALLDHPVPAGAIEEATAYGGFDPSEEAARGVVVLEEGAWRLTGEGRSLALELGEVIGSASAELWSRGPVATMPGSERLERLCDLVGRCLAAGRAGGGPAFTGVTPVFEPEGADAASILSSRLGALRHHRGDAHR